MFKVMNPIKREWLKKARKEEGLTSKQVADIFGISTTHYSDIENGRRNPSIHLCIEIADYFNVPIERLLEKRTKFKIEEEI